MLLGDFNIDLLHFNTSHHINTFVDDLASNFLQFQILLPTRVCKNSKKKKLIIYSVIYLTQRSNLQYLETIHLVYISDHFSTIFYTPRFFPHSIPTKYNVMSHYWENFNTQLHCAKSV